MKGEESEVKAALRALGDAARDAAAPARVEAALRAAFRQRVAQTRREPAWLLSRWAMAAASVAVMVVAVALTRHAPPPVPPEVAELVTEFIPLVYDDAPIESAQVVRVKLSRSSLAALGLPVDSERATEPVKADVIVSQDGVARAVRLVVSSSW